MKLSSNVVSCITGEIIIPDWAEQYLNRINKNDDGWGFYFGDLSQEKSQFGNYCYLSSGIGNDYSYRAVTNTTSVSSISQYIGRNKYIIGTYLSNIITIDITGSDDTYNLYYNDFIAQNYIRDPYNGWNTSKFYYMDAYNDGTYRITGYGNTTYSPIALEYSGTLEDCLKYLCNNVRNINIKVNGKLWSKANNTN